MNINMKERLEAFVSENAGGLSEGAASFRFPDVTIDTESIRTIMINEVVPCNPNDDFYGANTPPDYLRTTLPLFEKAGFEASSIDDILAAGIYITNAVKQPKSESAVSREEIEASLPILEYEIGLFPNLKVIMLMGDVAKKAFNMITKAKTKKNAVPSVSTYKLRHTQLFYGDIRIFPSYIMTGGNILIEKSKVEMAAEDIREMLDLID